LKICSWLLIFAFIALVLIEASATTEEIQLVASELKIFPVEKLRRVAIGDPDIADVAVLSAEELMLMAKATGRTSLIIWDESGQRTFTITVIDRNIEKIAQRIVGLLASASIRGVKVKTEDDAIYVMGEVLTQRELETINGILTSFPNAKNLVNLKERQPLVEIDVNVLEVAFDDLKNLGMDWSNSLPLQYTEPADIDGKLPKLWKIFRWSRSTIDARLNFLIQENKARTLANPKLITSSGKEASFLVGGEVPYLTVETYDRTAVNWKTYGVNLKIKPQVTAKGEIKTQIKAEVSELDSANAVTQDGFNIPALTKREVQTELFLNEGDTIFLAGLIKSEDSKNIDRLPWLSKVPILGELFKSKQFRDKRTELVISLVPRIISEKINLEAEDVSQAILKEEKPASFEARADLSEYAEANSPLTYYSHMIEDLIARNVVYPPEAQKAQQAGTVTIYLHLLSDGKLQEATIKESSGFSVLDKAALAAVQKQAPYPAFPAQISQKELRLTVPVVFNHSL
jgi:pilus assembly protein CpaC